MKLPKCDTPTQCGWFWFKGAHKHCPVNQPLQVQTDLDDEEELQVELPEWLGLPMRLSEADLVGQWYGPFEPDDAPQEEKDSLSVIYLVCCASTDGREIVRAAETEEQAKTLLALFRESTQKSVDKFQKEEETTGGEYFYLDTLDIESHLIFRKDDPIPDDPHELDCLLITNSRKKAKELAKK